MVRSSALKMAERLDIEVFLQRNWPWPVSIRLLVVYVSICIWLSQKWFYFYYNYELLVGASLSESFRVWKFALRSAKVKMFDTQSCHVWHPIRACFAVTCSHLDASDVMCPYHHLDLDLDLAEPPKLKEMRHYSMQTWPQNAGNPISRDFNLTNFPEKDVPRSPHRSWPSAVHIENPLF